ncbi:MAG: hypothetical protein V7667_11500 [Alloalcanivorax venustensis]|uniref:hypothetical protein n=1 Tax=Alloalcanivorax venustensis TaxID=172371 RepID=UPI003000FCEA
MSEQWIKVLRKIGKAFVIVFATLAVAALVAPIVSEQLALGSDGIRWFRLLALGLVAWGVLGKSGWEVQTYGGVSPHENFSSRWFLGLYVLGLFFGALGVLVEPVR